jgi:hypothetical protein
MSDGIARVLQSIKKDQHWSSTGVYQYKLDSLNYCNAFSGTSFSSLLCKRIHSVGLRMDGNTHSSGKFQFV